MSRMSRSFKQLQTINKKLEEANVPFFAVKGLVEGLPVENNYGGFIDLMAKYEHEHLSKSIKSGLRQRAKKAL